MADVARQTSVRLGRVLRGHSQRATCHLSPVKETVSEMLGLSSLSSGLMDSVCVYFTAEHAD
jgi:hypothetical protein